MTRKIFIPVFILSVLFAIVLFKKFSKDIYKVSPDYTISSDRLYAEFKKDESLARAKYSTKVIQISGILKEVYLRNNDELRLILRKDNEYVGISCILTERQAQVLKPLRLGNLITIKGLCKGIDTDVVLLNCILIGS